METRTSKIIKSISQIYYLLNKHEKRRAKKVVFAVVLNMALEVFSVGLIIPLLLILSKESFDGALNFLNNFPLKLTITLIIVFFIAKPFLSYYFNFYINKYKFSLKKSLSDRLLGQYIKSNYNKLITRNFDNLVKNIITSTSRCASFVGALTILLSELLVAFGVIIFLFFINPLAIFLSIVTILIIGYFYNQIFRSKLRKIGSQIEYYDGQMFSVLNYSFASIKELKIFKLDNLVSQNFDKPNYEISNLRTMQENIFIIPKLLFESVFALIIIVAVIFFTNNFSLQENIASVGAFGFAFLRILPSMNRIFLSLNTLTYTLPSVELIYNEMTFFNKSESEIKSIIDLSEKNFFSKINYSGPKTQKKILNNVNVSIDRNKTTCLFGPSGSGKTTLIDIISGLLTVDSMELTVDNKKILKNFEWKSLGYMGQNNYFINDTLKNNICLYSFKQKFDEERFKKSIKFACLDNLVSSHKSGENLIIGYDGARLSGGELQRLSLARVYYSNKDFLIFDEPTSALDEKTEDLIIENFRNMLKEKTILISTHQLKFKDIADRCIDL